MEIKASYSVEGKPAVERVKDYMRNNLSERELKAYKAAVSALYFNDSSDYQTALWEIVEVLANGIPEDYEEEFIRLVYQGISQLEKEDSIK